jgi:thiol-disulfide isomerase/thioredoxin
MSCRRVVTIATGLALVFLASCSTGTRDADRSVPPGKSGIAAADPAPAPPRSAPAAKKKPVADPSTPDAMVTRAEQVAGSGDLVEAMRLLEKALAAQPANRGALFLLAQVAAVRGDEAERAERSALYIQAAEAIRKLRDHYSDLTTQERELLPRLIYNEACAFALEGHSEKALDRLAESIDVGVDDPAMVTADDDLVSIRGEPRYNELIARLETVARARAARNAKAILAVNRPFPFRFELPDLEGKTVTLDDLKGSVLLVDFWGTWCPPCRKELPVYKQLLAKYAERGLAIVGLNYERVPDAYVGSTVRQFVAAEGVPFRCLIGDDKTRDQIPDFVGYPTTLILDQSRKVRAKLVGYHTQIALEALIQPLLEEAAPGPEPAR